MERGYLKDKRQGLSSGPFAYIQGTRPFAYIQGTRVKNVRDDVGNRLWKVTDDRLWNVIDTTLTYKAYQKVSRASEGKVWMLVRLAVVDPLTEAIIEKCAYDHE